MRLLLASAGLTNATVVDALEGLLGKPLGESRMVYVPTALHATPGGPALGWQMLQFARPGAWAEVGMLELTALPGLPEDVWLPMLESADAIYVGGGNTPYLCHWFERSGFGARLPSLLQRAVYVGASAGSMIAGTDLRIDRERLERDGIYDDDLYHDAAPAGMGSDRTLGLVEFAVRPHLNSPWFPQVTLERVRQSVTGPAWAIDDSSAVVVDGSRVWCASEGERHQLP